MADDDDGARRQNFGDSSSLPPAVMELLRRGADDDDAALAGAAASTENRGLFSQISMLLSSLGGASSDVENSDGGGDDLLLDYDEDDPTDDGKLLPQDLADLTDGDGASGSSASGGGGGTNLPSSKKLRERVARAATNGDCHLLATLLRSRASPDAVDADGCTPLGKAMINKYPGWTACLKVLLEAKADPNRRINNQSSGDLPLALAVVTRQDERVDLLLAAGAWPDGKAPDGKQSDSDAPAKAPIDIAVAVLRFGGLHDGRLDSEGSDAWRAMRCFSLLLAKTDDTVVKLRCLHSAASHNNASCVRAIQLLIDDGVDPDEIILQQVGPHQTKTYTALMHAVSSRAPLCVEALLAAGANPSTSVEANQTGDKVTSFSPMSLAKESKDRAIMGLLVEALQKGQRLVGCRVRVDGYRRAKPALNGKCGEVRSFDPKTGQCKVHLDLGMGYTRSHELSPTVLVPLDDELDEGANEGDGRQRSPGSSSARSDGRQRSPGSSSALADGRQRSPGSSSARSDADAQDGGQCGSPNSVGSESSEGSEGKPFECTLCDAVLHGAPLQVAALLAAGYRKEVNVEIYVEDDQRGEVSMAALRAAVWRMEANDCANDDDLAVFLLVIAAGADLTRVQKDGWALFDAQLPEALAELVRDLSEALAEGKDSATILEEQESPMVFSRHGLLTRGERALLSSVWPAPGSVRQALGVAAALNISENPDVIAAGPSSEQVSPLFLAYERESVDKQPTLTLLLLLAAGADSDLQLDRSATEEWKDEPWNLVQAAWRRKDTATLDFLKYIVDLRDEREETLNHLLLLTPADVQNTEEALELLISQAEVLYGSSEQIRTFMDLLPRAVRLPALMSALAQWLSDVDPPDSDGEEQTRQGMLGNLLCYAAAKDDETAVATLVAARADPGFQESQTLETALMKAVMNSNNRLVEFLIGNGAPYAQARPHTHTPRTSTPNASSHAQTHRTPIR